MMGVLAGVAAALACAGIVQAGAAAWLAHVFARNRMNNPSTRPAVTVLKPLHGDEPLLEEALTSLCRQAYPDYQIVFGVQDAADPAIAVVRRLQQRWREQDISLVVDPAVHGPNRKVGNLINMMPAARHDVLVIADADIHVRPDYLDHLVAALQQPGVGLVTTLYAGLPGAGLPARLGATQITHGFLPGALLARAFGRQDCLGATMCLRRLDLERIGGLHALAGHLADDNVLGQRIAALGLRVALAATVVLTSVTETRLRPLVRHELRWARTIRALEPAGYAASALQHPLAWALVTILLAGGAPWSIGLFFIAWVMMAIAGLSVDAALAPLWIRLHDTEEYAMQADATKPRGDGEPAIPRSRNDLAVLAFSCPVWLLPVRDILSVAVMVASYGGRQVDWRGHGLRADTPPPFTKQSMTLRL